MRRASLVLLACLASAAPASAVVQRDVKVLSGTVAAPGQFPWMAAIVDGGARDASGGQFCGGTVIAPRVVLTAAHCLPGRRPGELDVVIGRTRLSRDDGERLDVTALRVHPEYDPQAQTNDIALLQLASPTAAPAAVVPPAPDEAAATQPSARVVVAGWGATSEGGRGSDDLQFVRLTMRSARTCDRRYDGVSATTQLCAGGAKDQDSCQGDSGGPLFVGEGDAARLLGIVSYGEGCGRAGVPGVYTRVSGYAGWLAQEVPFLNGDAAAPPRPPAAPRVAIGKVSCGRVLCHVDLKVTGRDPQGGVLLNVTRAKTARPPRKAVDRYALARRIGPGRWRASVELPYGRIAVYAIPYRGDLDDLDGEGDVVEYEITR